MRAKGRTIRVVGGVGMVLGLVVGGGLVIGPEAEAAATCYGWPATISDHRGRIDGTSGDDVIIGDSGRNTIHGYGGNDLICAGDGNDSVDAGDDDDVVDGGRGDDLLLGWYGNDALYGDDGGFDTCYGGGGANYLDVSCEFF